MAALMALAFGTRLLFMSRGGGLLSIGSYDDGVYYAAADALVHGRLPYRDFLFIQPPGVLLASAPFAWLGSLTTDPIGFTTARIGFMVTGSLSTGLIAVILRRFGWAAAAFGGTVYAVTWMAVFSERSVLLETFGTLGVLAALAILASPHRRVSARWLLLTGFALGAATGFKIWYIVPAIVIIAFHYRQWLRLSAGAAMGAATVYLPFFVVTPSRMWQQVVADQLGRGRDPSTFLDRMRFMIGGQSIPDWLGHLGATTSMLTTALVILTGVAFITSLSTVAARPYAVLLAADAIVLIASPPFFGHYGALTMPMVAIVAGVAFGRLAGLTRRRPTQSLVTVAALLAVLAVNAHDVLKGTGEPVPTGLTQAAQRVDGCVMSDDPTVLPVMNVLSRNLAAGCRLWPDVTGWTYDAFRSSTSRANNTAWQKAVTGYLTSGSAVILLRPGAALSRESQSRITSGPVLYDSSPVWYTDGPWILHATPRGSR